jgi:ribosomal protein S30
MSIYIKTFSIPNTISNKLKRNIMPKSRNRKNHKKKVAARNQRIREQKNKMKKFQDAFFQQMMAEAKSGAFDDENVLELPNEDSEATTVEETEATSDNDADGVEVKEEESN